MDAEERVLLERAVRLEQIVMSNGDCSLDECLATLQPVCVAPGEVMIVSGQAAECIVLCTPAHVTVVGSGSFPDCSTTTTTTGRNDIDLCSDYKLTCPPQLRKQTPNHSRRTHNTLNNECGKRTHDDYDLKPSSKLVCFGKIALHDPTETQTCTVIARCKTKVWRLSRDACYKSIEVLKTLESQPLLAGLGKAALAELARGADMFEAVAGQVIVRHGQASNKLYLIEHGQVIGAIRDGGVSSLLDLQTEGEILWRFGAGEFFGEDPLVIDSQTTCTTDAVVASPNARVLVFPLTSVRATLLQREDIFEQVRSRFFSRILYSLHKLANVPTEVIGSSLSNQVRQLAFAETSEGIVLADCALADCSLADCALANNVLANNALVDNIVAALNKEMASTTNPLLIVLTQGALEFRQEDKLVGRLETGQSVGLQSLVDQGMHISAKGTTCILLVPISSDTSVVRCPRSLRLYSSNDNVVCFPNQSAPSVSLDSDSKCLKRNRCDPAQHNEKANSLDERRLQERRGQPLPLQHSQFGQIKKHKQTTSSEGFATYKKSKKQMQFLQSLQPIRVNTGTGNNNDDSSSSTFSFLSPETAITSSSCPSALMRKCDSSDSSSDSSSSGSSWMGFVSTPNSKASCFKTDSSTNTHLSQGTCSSSSTNSPSSRWPSMHPHADGVPEQQTSLFRGSSSPKKRKSGLVFSLQCLEKLDILGEGAFGTVNLVRHRDSNSVFALKQLSKHKIVAKHQENRVCSEKTLMERYGHHPFITSLVRTFRDSHSVYLLLEAGLGGDLFDMIANRANQSLSMEETRFYAPQLVLALEFLHQHQVVYRDLKPENAVLCVDGYLRLTDFGMAKLIDADSTGGLKRTYTLCGTPSFLAPEVLKLGGYGCSIDWWACGIMCFEISMGTFPFEAKNVVSLRKEHTAYQNTYPEYKELFERLQEKTNDRDFVDFVKQLIHPKQDHRLGSGSSSSSNNSSKVQRFSTTAIRNHPFIKDTNFDAFLRHDVRPPKTVFDCVASSRVLNAIKRFQPPAPEINDQYEQQVPLASYQATTNNKLWDVIF